MSPNTIYGATLYKIIIGCAMKITILRNKNNDLRSGATSAQDFFIVTDDQGIEIGKVTYIKNFPLSIGGTIIEIELINNQQADTNGKSDNQSDTTKTDTN